MLTLPPKFKQALGNGTRTSLYPLVRIYKGVQIDEPLDSATEIINLSIKETNIGSEAYNPLLLNSPSISSKADIINNKYTISSVSLSISNAPYKGKIFSDDIPSLLNAVVQVYYAANGLDTLEDCLLVYTGTIRRYNQSAETLSLTLEDLTEQKLKTKIPATLIEDEDTFTEDSIGKPYPMVYGYVDKSPLILDKYDSLIVEKPETEISGIWEKIAQIDFQNPYLTEYNYLRQTNWLKRDSFLYTYNNNYLPIMKEMPKNFGSRNYNLGQDSMYEFQNSSVGNSAKINLEPSNFVYEQYVTDDEDIIGKGQLGIPTRIYRPVKKVSFFANNTPNWQITINNNTTYYTGSTNKFFGFNGLYNYDASQTIINSGDNIDITNNNTNADNLYNEDWDTENDEATFSWWKPTDLNNASNTNDDDGIFDDKDANYEEQGKNPYFPVKWIQDTSDYSGLHIFATGRQENYQTGSFARLELNENVPDYPCVTKLFYRIDYFAPTNIDYQHSAEPTAFWSEKSLIQRKFNDNQNFNDLITNKNDWQENYDTEDWTTACEFPNHEHGRTENALQNRYTNTNLGGTEFDNINLGFSTTNSSNSIQWGLPRLRGGFIQRVNSCIANLKQFYTIQDVLVTEYIKENFYGSIKGRIDDDENVISKPHNILQDILKEELAYEKNIIMPDEDIQDDWIHSFTLKEQKETKGVIENLFKSSIYIPSFDSAGNFKFIDLKQNIEDYEQFESIDNQDIVKYSFALTKLEDVKNQVNVKYKKDYGANDYSEETGYGIENNNGITSAITLDELTTELTSDMLYDISYYGIKNEDAKLDIETEYIRDKNTARKLQRRLLMWYANQHITMKIDLPPSYIHLEAGDYIKFDELIGGKLAFGFDYTQEFVKNGQLIYPVFFVTKTAKSLTKVSLELVQVHRGDFGMSDDNLGNYKIPNPYMDELYQPVEEEDFPATFTASFDTENADLQQGQITAIVNTNQEGSVNYEIFFLASSHTFEVDVLGLDINFNINAGTYYENPLSQAEYLVIDNVLITDSEYGDNVTISPYINRGNIIKTDESEENIDNENIELIFGIRIIHENNESLLQELNFRHTILASEYELGDVNRDNVINVQDVVMLVQYILTLQEFDQEQERLADITEDGVINILDVVNLVQGILGN